MGVNAQRYLKNNTGATRYYLGVPIAAGAFYEIPPSKYIAYANLESVMTDIGSGDISVSRDGVSVISGLNNQINALKGFEADTTSVEVVGGAPVLPSTFKIEFDDSNISVTSSYATLYSYTGSGTFHGGTFDFNSDSVRVRLTIDGNVVLVLTLDEVESIQSFSSGGCNDGGVQNIQFVSKTSGNRLNLHFPVPIKYDTSVLVEAQRTSGYNKTQSRQLVYLTKES